MEALNVLRHLLSLRKEEFLDPDSLEDLQRKRIAALAEAASKTNHYSRIFAERGIDPSDGSVLESLPLTKKQEVRADPLSFIPSDVSPSSLTTVQTSGSTGTPTRIYQDEEIMQYRHALKYALELSLGRSPLELFAHIFFHDFEANSFLSMSGLFPKLFLQVSDPEEEIFDKILRRRPKVLRGYPSVLSSLARLNHGGISFKSVISGGELITRETRELIEESFSCKVYNHYGCMEASTIAKECPEERRLHVSSCSLKVEIVDGKGKAKKSGPGEIAITPLFNTRMPLMRYLIGDRARWGKACTCGRAAPVLERLDGRTDDVIILPSGRVRPGMSVHPMVSSSSIDSYQVIQETPERLVFRYVPSSEDMPEDLKSSIRERMLRGCLNEDVSVEFEIVDEIKKGKTGKIRTIVSKVKGADPR